MFLSALLRSALLPGLVAFSIVSTGFHGQVSAEETPRKLSQLVIERFGTPPPVPEGPLSDELATALDTTFGDNLRDGQWGTPQNEGLQLVADSGDPRLAWIVSDLMRIAGGSGLMATLSSVAGHLLQTNVAGGEDWHRTVDRLIAWNIPAPPNYLKYKRNIYTLVEPSWSKLFVEGDIDWRHVSWGGVGIDSRPFRDTDQACNCIPAADNPRVTDAAGADWLKDEDIVFGIEVNGVSRAYPRQIMEVREMINDTLGGRDLGIPYCTLCGAAQAYLTHEVPEGVERPVLRTSGLLIRSNKIMYDVNSFSIFDTFKGKAVTGPLAEKGIALDQIGVVTTSWGEWKKAYPQTTVLAEELSLGRNFDFRNNRDANGPIFPIGDVDPRLPVHADIVGIVTASGIPLAFPVDTVRSVLKSGQKIAVENVHLVFDGGGLKAVDSEGKDLGGHQAFWFAWSQFYPDTILWENN
jgi:hypothetical protein